MGGKGDQLEVLGGSGGGEKGSDSKHILQLELISSADGPDVGCGRGRPGRPQRF